MKLQFCCGGNRLPGWQNYDMDCDLTKLPLPFESESADVIFIEHGLEHFTVAQAVAILDEFYRVLKKGGKLRVCCPVLERLDKDAARDIALNHGHLIIFSSQSLKDLIRIAGFQNIQPARRDSIDGHYRVIGTAKDDLETARFVAIK